MHLNTQKLLIFNTNIVNIHPMSTLLFDIGANIAQPNNSKGSLDIHFRGDHHNKVILCSDRHGNSEEELWKTKMSKKIDYKD